METPAATMSSTRPRRPNAGNRLQEVLLETDALDEFYQTAYGGFVEEENDLEYQPEAGADIDEADSDFSADEGDADRSATNGTAATSNNHHQQIDSHTQVPRKKRIKKKIKYSMPSQEELLREAKQTERENTRSLELYQRLELNKARRRTQSLRKGIEGPFIRTISASFPLIEEVEASTSSNNGSPASTTISNYEAPESSNSSTGSNSDRKRWARNFVIFSDDQLFNETFKQENPRPTPHKRNISPISHHRARYFDPLTHVPFASASTFKVIRQAYYKKLEQIGNEEEKEAIKNRLLNRQQKQPPPPPPATETNSLASNNQLESEPLPVQPIVQKENSTPAAVIPEPTSPPPPPIISSNAADLLATVKQPIVLISPLKLER